MDQYLKDNDIQVHKMTKSWEENNNAYLTNWNTYGNAIEEPALGSREWKVGMTNTWYDFDVTGAIKEYYADPSKNFGFMLCNYIDYPFTNYEGSLMLFTTSESSPNSLRPKMTVEYETGSGIVLQNRYTLPTSGPYQVVITDVKGRQLADFSVKSAKQIENMVSTLSAGVKLVNISAGKVKMTRKVIVR